MRRSAIFGGLVLVVQALSAQSAPPKAGLTPEEQTAALSAIREYSLHYSNALPNFICTRSIKRVTSPVRTGYPMITGRPQTDLIEEQLSLADRKEIHKISKINGKAPANEDPSELGGMYSRGEFGFLLTFLFAPEANTEFRWQKAVIRGGRPMYAFSYHVPQASGYGITDGERTFRVAVRGTVYADAETKAVMRIEMVGVDIPTNTYFRGMELSLDYQATKVAGQQFILPSKNRIVMRRVESEAIIESEYKNYRRFSSEAAIIFDEDAPQ
ncbi:MAG: hypothetical protein ABI811_23170 [Acidobacteriota bacterium]